MANAKNLFRVMVARVRHSTYDKLAHVAKVETERTGRQVYVADLVREAIKLYLRKNLVLKDTLDGSDDEENTFHN